MLRISSKAFIKYTYYRVHRRVTKLSNYTVAQDMDQNEHLSLTERGRCAFEQAEEEKFTNPTAAAAYYIIASKCYLAAAESVDQLDVLHLCSMLCYL